jgi:hypothetical protein
MSLFPVGISRSRDVQNMPSKSGDDSPQVKWRRSGELACAFFDAPHGAVRPMHHAAALKSIHNRANVLPIKFGAEVKDETQLGDLLQDKSNELLDRLAKLDGACEIAVRITLPPKAKKADGDSEHEHLLVQQFIERLQGLYRDWRRVKAPAPNMIYLTFLVQRDRATSFKSRALAALNGVHDTQAEISSPHPPYSFA